MTENSLIVEVVIVVVDFTDVISTGALPKLAELVVVGLFDVALL